MDATANNLKTTNKGAIVGGILCIVTAVVMGCFCVGSMIINGISTLTYIINSVSAFIDGFMTYGDIVYLQSVIVTLLKNLVAFCTMITSGVGAIALLVMGIVLLIKKSGKGMIIFSAVQIVLSLLNVLMHVGNYAIVFIIGFLANGRFSVVDLIFNSYVANAICSVSVIICWAVFAVAVVLIAKKKISTRGAATVTAIVTAALFAVSRLLSVPASVWALFGPCYQLWSAGESIDVIISYITPSLISLPGSAITSGIMAVLFAVTFFFVVKGISNAYIQKEN